MVCSSRNSHHWLGVLTVGNQLVGNQMVGNLVQMVELMVGNLVVGRLLLVARNQLLNKWCLKVCGFENIKKNVNLSFFSAGYNKY